MRKTNIAQFLPSAAQMIPYVRAIVCPVNKDRYKRTTYAHLTFLQLNQLSDQYAHGFVSQGLTQGKRCVLMFKPSLEFFVLTFALYKIGAVPVFIDPGIGMRYLKQCLKDSEPYAFIGIRQAHIARKLFRWGASTLRLRVTDFGTPWLAQKNLAAIRKQGKNKGIFPITLLGEEEPAAILFTSGSTGVPKGAVYTHQIFEAQIQHFKDELSVSPGEVDLATFPLFALFAPALRMTAIIPDMDATRPAQVNPQAIFSAIEDHGVTNLFGSPALLKTISQYGVEHSVFLPSLKQVVSAGAPVSAHTLRKMKKLMPKTSKIWTAYGATEALPISFIEGNEIIEETSQLTEIGKGICVGVPVKNLDVRIIQISDKILAHWEQCSVLTKPGAIGEIVVSGDIVTKTYFKQKDCLLFSKIYEKTEKKFWHRLGDVGYFDQNQRLWYCGRKTHRVCLEDDSVLFTIPVEGVFNTHEKVARSALVGIPYSQGLKKQEPVLCIELKSPASKKSQEKITEELKNFKERFPMLKSIKKFLFHKNFPVDIRHNSKISREKLSNWAEKECL